MRSGVALALALLLGGALDALGPLRAAAEESSAAGGGASSDDNAADDDETLLAKLLDEAPYDPTMRPGLAANCTRGGAVADEVVAKVELTAITAISEKLMKVELAAFVDLEWLDLRLRFNGTAEGGCFDETFVPPDKWEDIWAPDVYVANAIDTDYGSGFLRLRHDGAVTFSRTVLFHTAMRHAVTLS